MPAPVLAFRASSGEPTPPAAIPTSPKPDMKALMDDLQVLAGFNPQAFHLVVRFAHVFAVSCRRTMAKASLRDH